MKKTLIILFLFSFLSSCVSFHNLLTNSLSTNVVLNQSNFEVIEQVSGSATATYVFGYGGNKIDAIIQNARSNMLRQVDLLGSSRAIANEVVETKIQFIVYPIVVKVTATTSAHIIEFDK